MLHKFLRIRDVLAQSGLGRSTLYNRISDGLWPKQVSLGARAVGWAQEEIQAVNEARLAGQTDDEIRALVSQLEAQRQNLIAGESSITELSQ